VRARRQVNGKARGEIMLPKDAGEEMARELALADEKVVRAMDGKGIKKFIYVPGRIVNIVLGKAEAPAAEAPAPAAPAEAPPAAPPAEAAAPAVSIDAKTVKALRDATGAGMMDCAPPTGGRAKVASVVVAQARR
jgi:hypothetical protein